MAFLGLVIRSYSINYHTIALCRSHILPAILQKLLHIYPRVSAVFAAVLLQMAFQGNLVALKLKLVRKLLEVAPLKSEVQNSGR